MTPSTKNVEPRQGLTAERTVAVLWESVVEGSVSALLVSVLGGVAVNVLGALFGNLIPSVPPVLSGRSTSVPASAETLNAWWHSIRAHGFAILFTLFFLHNAWVRLSSSTPEETKTGVLAHLRKILGQFSENWFHITVGNAIGALISATVLVWVQRFSLSRIVWQALLGPVTEAVHNLANHVLGPSRMDTIDGLISWYRENQFKFTFWILYMAAVCDDLGLPNLKTLARKLWGGCRAGRRTRPSCRSLLNPRSRGSKAS
jgi:hypothetical protein